MPAFFFMYMFFIYITLARELSSGLPFITLTFVLFKTYCHVKVLHFQLCVNGCFLILQSGLDWLINKITVFFLSVRQETDNWQSLSRG